MWKFSVAFRNSTRARVEFWPVSEPVLVLVQVLVVNLLWNLEILEPAREPQPVPEPEPVMVPEPVPIRKFEWKIFNNFLHIEIPQQANVEIFSTRRCCGIFVRVEFSRGIREKNRHEICRKLLMWKSEFHI